MNKEQAESRLVLCGYAGSITYGTNTAQSDTDIRGIFIPPKDYWIGLKKVEQVDGNGDIDYCYFSLQRFFDLALQNNPNILEQLWLRENHYLWKNVAYPEIGKKLIANRDLFLSKRARYRYMGYAYDQVKRLQMLNKNVNKNEKRLESVEKFGYDTKNAMHCMRLMRQGLEILNDGKLEVFRHDARELMDIREGKYTYEQIIAMFEEYKSLMELAYVKTSLPADPPFDKVEALLMEIAEEFFWSKK